MKDFLKKNKFIILIFSLLIIFIFSYFYRASAYTYESLDFKYGKVTAKTTLNIRCGPGTNYDRVGKLNNGDYINVFAKVGDWYIVQTTDNVVGAVSCKYIEAIYDEQEMQNYIQTKSLENIENEETTQTSTLVNSSSEYIDNF